tara:strand:- start:6702 stop:9596 length:2895 start_codon:yes stop_codon:yes gene_type:complete
MDNIVTGFPNIPLSITNPDVSERDALDKFAPFKFVEFIKSVTEDYDPDTLAAFYNKYLNRWNITASKKDSDNTNSIIDLYKDFLKDLTINFSTRAEQRFFAHLNFDDTYDLRIAMSFFSKKIRDIISYYKKKRQTLNYTVTKAKVKGSHLGVRQVAKDLIIDYLENRDTASLDYDIDIIKSNLSVSLTEYFDNFAQYFNSEPDADDYGKNFIEYDPAGLPTLSIFLNNDSALIQETFTSVATDLLELKEVTQLFKNKRKQTSKFIGADFYYLSTDINGIPEIGILFEADKPYANFVNQNYPSVASVFSDDITSERDQGFFRPHNSSIVAIQGKRIDFFTRDQYDPGQFYIFPDPNLYTNNQDILTFIVDTSRSVNNRSKGIAINQPNTDKDSTSFLGYNSEIGEDRDLDTDLSYLYDQGYIADGKKDIFGNIFGLVKDNNYYRSNITSEDPDIIKNLVLNGYQFFDDLYGEGYDFNYSTSDSSTYTETIRSGISSFTNSLVTLPTSAYNIFFRYFTPYQELKQPSNFLDVDFVRPEDLVIDADVKEAAYFMYSDTEALADPTQEFGDETLLVSGLSSYKDSALQFYYSDLVDAGGAFWSGNTVFRGLCDPTNIWTTTLSGDFTVNVRLSGTNGVSNYDCGKFTDDIIFNYSQAEEGFDYEDSVYNTTQFTSVDTAQEQLFNRRDHAGKLYVNNINQKHDTPSVQELTNSLPYFPSKYNTTVCHQLSSSVREFDLLYTTLFIETSTFLVTEKTKYENNVFVSPITPTNYLTINTSFFDKISNRIRVNNNVFFCRLVRDQLSLRNNRLYPKIYKYNYSTDTTEVIFPTTGNSAANSSCYFNLSDTLSVYIESGTPFLTYSSDNEQFNLGVLIKDLNKGPLLLNYLFEYTDKVVFLDTGAFTSNTSRFTYTFADDALSSQNVDLNGLNFALSSQIPAVTATHQIPEFAHTPVLSSLSTKISATALIL